MGRLWERHQSKLQRGRTYGLRWHQVDLRRTSLSYVDSSSALHLECGPVSKHFRLTMPEEGRVRAIVDGHPVEATPERGVLYAPGQELKLEIEPFRSLLFTIDAELVERAARQRFECVPPPGRWTNSMPLNLAAAAALRSLCQWLGHELDRPATPLLTTPRVGSSFERTVLTLFLECLAANPGFAEARSAEELSALHLRLIEEWLDEHFLDPIGVEDMASVAGIGVRAVQALFRRVRNCTPMEAVVTRRLAHARNQLLAADAMTTVTEVAYDCNFFHLSRFAARYAQTYGERPSETLARSPRSAGSLRVAKQPKNEN
ncbi:MAG: AraC family transcriptional regulator [Rhodospirillales bacterium]